MPRENSDIRRWVDLQSYVFTPPSETEEIAPINFSKPPVTGSLDHLHPISLLRLDGKLTLCVCWLNY